MKTAVHRLSTFLAVTLPAILFFSYLPTFSLGSNASTNFELSLPLVWLGIFSVLNLPLALRRLRHHRRLLLLLIPLIYCALTILWSSNRLRGFLTVGILACLFISCLTLPQYLKSKATRVRLIKVFLTTTVLVCLFCWAQCLFDLLQSPPLGLCPGCTYINLGFPHPNGFAIEPQFMGNLLLAPALLCLYLRLHHSSHPRTLICVFLIVVSTLFLTLSRGAIFAFILALTLLLFRERSHLIKPLLLTALAFLLSLGAQGIFATLSPTNDNFLSGVTKSLSQLSLGLIPPLTPPAPATPAVPAVSLFNGYVAESTTDRLDLNQKALVLWLDHPFNTLFGIGLGDSGPELFRRFNVLGSAKEIVQNEYLAILLELGLVGTGLILATLLILLRHLKTKLSPPRRSYLFTLLVAYAFSLLFFSGLPNALHIYLLPTILLSLCL